MACVIGKSYNTRFGYVKLRERTVSAVTGDLLDIPEDVAKRRAGYSADMRARRCLIDCLKRWREEALKICIEKVGEDLARAGTIYVNSCYRKLGTTAGSGKYGDPCGCIDSTDNYGHWSGYSADIPTGLFRKSCFPVLSVSEIRSAAYRAGLELPFLSAGEWWHFRPVKELR